MIESRFIDFIASLFGRGRAKLGEWPHADVVTAAVVTLHGLGGKPLGENGTPADELRILRFRVRGHRVRLCIEEYGDVVLWGPKRLVAELATRIEQKLAEGPPKETPD